MRIWLTKHCLTMGIEEVEGLITESNPEMVQVIRPKDQTFHGTMEFAHGKGKDWHLTKESAILVAEKMKEKKIKSLQKQIEKLDKMTF